MATAACYDCEECGGNHFGYAKWKNCPPPHNPMTPLEKEVWETLNDYRQHRLTATTGTRKIMLIIEREKNAKV